MRTLRGVGAWKRSSVSFGSATLPTDRIPGILWTTDLQFSVTYLAGSGIQILNRSVDEYVSCSAALLFRDNPTEALDAHFLAAAGESCAFEVEIGESHFQARVEPLLGENSDVVGVIGAAIENTERKVAQDALRISEQSYRSLIEDAPHAVCRSTPDGSLLQVNRAMQDMLGYCETDLLMCNLRTEIFVNPEQYTAFLEKLKGKTSWHGFESQWRRRDGQAISVRLGGRGVLDSAGECYYIDVFAENVTAHVRLEEQLRHAQKMQAVGHLAGGIAHDFNNVLTVIHGHAEIMSQQIQSDDPLVSRLEEIRQAANRAAALTRQLLAFSRRQVLQPRILNINGVVSNLSQMLARLIGENIELKFNPGENLWPVIVDRGQIEQVLMNLAVNARDAMPDGGQLTIETHNVESRELGCPTDETNPPGYVQLNVRDNGYGMDEATKSSIFEPFFTTKPVGKGTGLGLSVVYGVIRQSGGHIQVESWPGRGAEFRIFLPRAVGDEEHAASQEFQTCIPVGDETILLVEDDDAIRQLTNSFLQDQGYRVLIAEDGAEAMRLMEDGNPVALLLSDMMMPKMGGRELATRLREIMPDLKVILMSGHPQEPPDSGTHFLQKPFSLASLATTVRIALNSPE
jgi:PAS domain S-box-containing protein